jgi:Nif-specific regulatory protein
MIRGTSHLSPESLAMLAEASAAINSTLDLQTVLDSIARSAAAVMRVEAVSVLLLDRRRNKLLFAAAVGDASPALLGEEFDADLGIAGRVLASRQAEIVDDVTADPQHFKGIDERSRFQTRSIVAAPMIHKDRAVGVVEVLNRIGGDVFGPGDIELIQVFANLAAIGVNNALVHEDLKRENRCLRETVLGPATIVGSSAALREVLALCDRVARSNATVLLLGETGTGKELFARYIHRASNRRDKPLVAINCAALTETLLESELFGHEKGAFTGATSQKIGRFELADHGTLFLDEIGDISRSTQVKLLRVLQERDFVRVGGTRTLACDVRIIAATNRQLKAAVDQGAFREDLYYRLNVFPISSPPLRQRREDIPSLVEHFSVRAARDLDVPAPKISDDFKAVLTAYDWPGNIRELQNVVERAVLMCDGEELQRSHLPREIAAPDDAPPPQPGDSSLWDYERAMIINALSEHRWNRSAAARALGISRDNLRYRIKKYGIKRPTT